MFGTVNKEKSQFLENRRAIREERAFEKDREEAACKIQAQYRGYKDRQAIKKEIRSTVDELLKIPLSCEEDYIATLRPALEVYNIIKKFLFIYHEKDDQQRFEYLCRYLLASMDSDNVKLSYVFVALQKDEVLSWIQQIKDILWRCVSQLRFLKPENHQDQKRIMVFLRLLVAFTHTATWKILKGKGACLEKPGSNSISVSIQLFFPHSFLPLQPLEINDGSHYNSIISAYQIMGPVSREVLTPGMNQLCCNIMGYLNSKELYPVLQILLTKGLARTKPVFNKATLSAIITISLRPLLAANFSDNLLSVFILHILSVPAVIYHVNSIAPDCMTLLISNRVFRRSLDLLVNEQSTRIIFNSLEGNYALCLLANLVLLGFLELEGLVENTLNFMTVMIRLLERCKTYVQNKRSNLTHWHPVLGWFSQQTDQSLHEAMPYVVKQLQLLWGEKMIRLLFSELIEYVSVLRESQEKQKASPSKNILRKALEKASSKNSSVKIKLGSSIATSTCLPGALYQACIKTLSQLQMDILGGLSYNDILLPILWQFLCDLGQTCGLKVFLDLLSQAPNSTIHPIFSLLNLFCEAATHLITTLDDVEMYEQQRVFKLEDYTKMGEFLNLFIFRIMWDGLMDVQIATNNEPFNAAQGLLLMLYERDSRRSFTPENHWLIRDIKPSAFISELDKGRRVAQFLLQRVPFILPFTERVKIFRKNVIKEKDVLGLTESACASPHSTLITVHRSRIVEDGYRQLAQLPPKAMKGVIRVKFINEQGLAEAGIDQDGVFKEFLEETIARVFDPSLNLFKLTSEQKLYPSSTAYIQENHLQLFEFVGKMVAKAVYEGIVVEVPFAPFFLTQMLSQGKSSTYSSLDELPSLDPDLAKSLSYVKHYEGDVSDLELTFSCDEDCMGRLETHELVPGGKAIPVTNENRIRYVHLMAHFRMYRQIKEQTTAFISGFKSVIASDWLGMFSSPELQKLISGDNIDLDIEDLRRHTQYFGGYHNNHKVINWLWSIVQNDFTLQERALFLKFVTSCSKPPLLGFAHLEPPFSIRCVEVSDDQDTGDTVGSVLKGFFNIKKRDPVGRLPTSSTCFNLLKLPNYQKKSILKEKLKYAIHSNTGFELS